MCKAVSNKRKVTRCYDSTQLTFADVHGLQVVVEVVISIVIQQIGGGSSMAVRADLRSALVVDAIWVSTASAVGIAAEILPLQIYEEFGGQIDE